MLAFAPEAGGYAAIGGSVLALVIALVVHRFTSRQPPPPAEASEHGWSG
ncbi:hypothetical protein NLX83_19210 [Allokutzneria sp. A3M-2-11 16]|nr:hypothetical protein [Allokutzneria sp. A3M-2-11 16]MCP3801390.1 hypothetical protein [Allokutzneria sp. A3M-2-11 16]